MATFFIQYDKPFFFAGDTVNGQIFINVGAMIVGAQGISLKFTGYESVKWVQAQQLHRPNPHAPRPKNSPPPYDPIAHIPPHEIIPSNNLNISSCYSSDDPDVYTRRPKYIRTSQNRYFKMQYFDTRNLFTVNKMMIYQCNGFAPGQYSFPFSFKTFEGWPASFQYHTPQKKGVISYNMTVAIEPVNSQFNISGSRAIILRQTRVVQSQQNESTAAITSCCCISKGIAKAKFYFQKDGYCPGELVQILLQIDNSQCQANMTGINIGVSNVVSLRSQGNATSDSRNIFSKTVNGIMAGQTAEGPNAIRQSFTLPNTPDIKPTCSGKLLSAQYNLYVRMSHDINCQCCSDSVGSSIPVIIFPQMPVIQMPSVFQTNWTPQIMPEVNMILPNNFTNFNLSNMGQMGQYPM